jgi:hypothetical protein
MLIIFIIYFLFICLDTAAADGSCGASSASSRAASSVSSEASSIDYIKFINDIELDLPRLIASKSPLIHPLIPTRSPLEIEADDPFKERLTLIEAGHRLEEINPDHVAFSDKTAILSLGDFELDLKFYLGCGDEGVVRLGLHKESGILVAVKAMNRNTYNDRPKIAPEVIFLHKLGRLYGYFLVGNLEKFKKITDVVVSPLALGQHSYDLRYSLPKAINDRLSIGNLFFKELFYLAKRGVYQVDQQLTHYITNICNTEMCAVDFSGLVFAYDERYLKTLGGVTSYAPREYKFTLIQTHVLIGLLGGKFDGDDSLRKTLESAPHYRSLKTISEESPFSRDKHNLEEVYGIFKALEEELLASKD